MKEETVRLNKLNVKFLKKDRIFYYIDILGPILGIVLWTMLMAIVAPHFLEAPNIINILYQASIYIILAIGMTFIITGGGIDLSIGSIVALSGVAMAYVAKFTAMPSIIAILAAIAVGTLCGLLNGLFVVKLKVPEFIATIATMIGYRGLVLVSAGGLTFYGFPDTITFLGGYRLFGILPVPILLAFGIAAIGYFIYQNTKFGRYTIAMGGNKEAALLAGINVKKYKVLTFVFMGFLCGLAGVLIVGRLDSFNSNLGQLMELDVIAAVIIGGTALFGGVGRVWGACAGAILLAMVVNGVVILGLPYFYQYIAVAVVILLAVSLYTLKGQNK